MSILEQAISTFESRPRLSVEVPEWTVEGKPVVVVYYKTPNAKTISKIQKEAGSDQIEQAARLVAIVASDENGKRHFSDADYSTLMIQTDPKGLSRVAAAILSGAKVDVEAAEKN